MPFKDKLGRICGFLDIDEDDKRKRFLRRYFILNKTDKLLEWYMDSPSVNEISIIYIFLVYLCIIEFFYTLLAHKQTLKNLILLKH